MVNQLPIDTNNSQNQLIEEDKATSQLVTISATFTAEPVEESLNFWLSQLSKEAQVKFAPYNQVFQQLLDPTSLLNSNRNGVNVVLIRFEDWQRYELNSNESKIERNTQDLVNALKTAGASAKSPYLVCICPGKPDSNLADFCQQMEQWLAEELHGLTGVYLVNSHQLTQAYPVESYYDPKGDEMGHIPFTPEFFTALGTIIARRVYALKSSPHKVIVLDCDQTLWRGVCGEDGAMGITIDPPRRALQELMVKQYEAGMLLCLCSKNVEEDVWEVFEHRQDMLIKREYLVSWRINWQPKSENIKALAQELNLGLDSFIFIDDNPVECSEVQANCPEVLTLQLPCEVETIPHFLEHIWPLDRLKTTTEDRQRTKLYQQNLQREQARSSALTFADFLAALELKIAITPMSPQQLPRVAQLTQRTNQFNATTIRRSEAEIQQLLESEKLECLTITVSDRFGDYGLVGVILFATKAEGIEVDTFLLSCRVLGRGVEHGMVAKLGEIAHSRGLELVKIGYQPTKKNLPIRQFLDSVASKSKQLHREGLCYSIPTELAAQLNYTPQEQKLDTASHQNIKSQISSNLVSKSNLFNGIATQLSTPEQILTVINNQQQQRETNKPVVAPSTETEQKLAQIWQQLLHLKTVSIDDNYFELGGTSVLAVRLFSQVEELLGKSLPLTTLVAAPTIAQLAIIIDQQENLKNDKWSSLVAIQPQGNKTPFFCVHGGFGDVIGFWNLAQQLGKDQPFYALQAVGLDGKLSPLNRIEAMATYHIQEIKKVQPQGPYLLGGLCIGGIVAYEMAQQLQMQGQEVALVALLDTETPGPSLAHVWLNHRLPYYLRNFFPVVYRLRDHWQRLSKLSLAEQWRYGFEKIISRFKPAVKVESESTPQHTQPLTDWEIELSKSMEARRDRPTKVKVQLYEGLLQAFANYQPKSYSGKVVFFLPDENPINSEQDPRYGWRNLVTEDWEVCEFTGDHDGMTSGGKVHYLAEKLQEYFN